MYVKLSTPLPISAMKHSNPLAHLFAHQKAEKIEKMYAVQSTVFREFYVKVNDDAERRIAADGTSYLVYELAEFEEDILLTVKNIKTGAARHLFVSSDFDPSGGLPVDVFLVDMRREHSKSWVGACHFRPC